MNIFEAISLSIGLLVLWTTASRVYWFISGAVFLFWAYDKGCAQQGRWRVPEVELIISLFLSPVGALAAMMFFNHKIRKEPFPILASLAVPIWAANQLYQFLPFRC